MNPSLLRILRSADGSWYMGQPYTGYRPPYLDSSFGDLLEEAAMRGAHASGELYRLGITHHAPIPASHLAAKVRGLNPRDHSLWMPHCIKQLKQSCGLIVLTLPGWEMSIGLSEERRIADDLGIPTHKMAPTDE